MNINDGHRGDAYKPALMTMVEIATLYDVATGRIRSARKHMAKHPKPVARIRKTDYFHAHAIHEYIKTGEPLKDLQEVEKKARRGYLANVKSHSKKRVVRNISRTVALQSFNVARAW